jgi:hypothetical protein
MQTKIMLAAVIAVVMTGIAQAQQSHTTSVAPSDQATVLRSLPSDAFDRRQLVQAKRL